MTLDRYATNVLAFIDDLVRVTELGQAFHLLSHQREVLRLAFAFDTEGRLPWDTIVYSCPKKSGKTTINAAVTAWWMFTQEPPNECYVLANDLEQAQSRVFKALAGLIRQNPALASSAEIQARTITLSSGTTTTVLANEWASAAGSNHGLTSWDELWGYTAEKSRRLWEELPSVPTRRNSIRFVSTYAGLDGESDLLAEVYREGVGPEEHPDGQGTRLHPTLPIYGNRAARVFAYWDHEGRMPWQTPTYYESQRRAPGMRPDTYDRIHRNVWTTSESRFITAEMYDRCEESGWSPLDSPSEYPIYVGVDASVTRAATAVVWVLRDPVDDLVVLAGHRIWTPSPGRPIPYAEVEACLEGLGTRFVVARVAYDPYQFVSVAQRLAGRLPMVPFVQSEPALAQMAQVFWDLIQRRGLVVYPDDEVRAHVLAATARETTRGGFRLVTDRPTRRIDAAIALGMAAYSAVTAAQWAEPRLISLGG